MRTVFCGVFAMGLTSCTVVDDACESRCRDFGAFWAACDDIMIRSIKRRQAVMTIRKSDR